MTKSSAHGSESDDGSSNLVHDGKRGADDEEPGEETVSKGMLGSTHAERLDHRRELNRRSKKRCRKRKGDEAKRLQDEVSRLTVEHNTLRAENEQLRQEYIDCSSAQNQSRLSSLAGLAGFNFSAPQIPFNLPSQLLQPASQQLAAAVLMQNISQPSQTATKALPPSGMHANTHVESSGAYLGYEGIAGGATQSFHQQQGSNQFSQLLLNLLNYDSRTASAGQTTSASLSSVNPFALLGHYADPLFLYRDEQGSGAQATIRHTEHSNTFPGLSALFTRPSTTTFQTRMTLPERTSVESETLYPYSSLLPTNPAGFQSFCGGKDGAKDCSRLR